MEAETLLSQLPIQLWQWALEVSKCGQCFMGLVVGFAFLLMTPVTHGVLGRKLHGPSEWQIRKTTFQGGRRFILLQAISWAAWSTSLLALFAAAVVVLNAYAHSELPSPVLSGAAVCGAVLSEVLQICSLLFFQVRGVVRSGGSGRRETQERRLGLNLISPESVPLRVQEVSELAPASPRRSSKKKGGAGKETKTVWLSAKKPHRLMNCHLATPLLLGVLTHPRAQGGVHGLRNHRGAALVIVLGVVLSLTVRGGRKPPVPVAAPGCTDLPCRFRRRAPVAPSLTSVANPFIQGHGLVASVALEAVAGTRARLLFTSIAAVCIIISAPLTHGLAGRLRHKEGAWQFVNPGA